MENKLICETQQMLHSSELLYIFQNEIKLIFVLWQGQCVV